MERRKKKLCPSCGQLEGVLLVWGEPDEKTSAAAERGEIIHAGNVIWKKFLDFHCKACGHQWSDPKVEVLASHGFK